MNEIAVLDKGFVRLDDYMADDLSVANAARVSFAKYVEELGNAEIALIRFLMFEHHGTPFEHNAFRLHVKCPIFVAREWFRHRIASYNEMSGRYVKLEKEFYFPQPDEVRSQVGKPGAYTFEPVSADVALDFISDLIEWVEQGWAFYEKHLEAGVAKEQARFFIANTVHTQFWWTINARSLMNFLALRSAPTAMREIREYANVIFEIFKEIMPHTASAFIDLGLVAP